MSKPLRVFVGWDLKELTACHVTVRSMRRHATEPLHIEHLSRPHLERMGLYWRETTLVGNQMFDVPSWAHMSTAHAIARFFVPMLCGFDGWALFTDGDLLVRDDLAKLFALADPDKALMVVPHPAMPATAIKKIGQAQSVYPRKNWSSVMLFNCAHPAHRSLTLDELNTRPGRELHAFCWLQDEELGFLPDRWNHLVGVTPDASDVAIAHFTLGSPRMPGRANDPFAGEWEAMATEYEAL
jgi:lipopolysaccharide biosynthesis glycosyltransferase